MFDISACSNIVALKGDVSGSILKCTDSCQMINIVCGSWVYRSVRKLHHGKCCVQKLSNGGPKYNFHIIFLR